MKNIYLLLLASSFLACETTTYPTPTFQVAHYGALKNMMKKGDLSAKVALEQFKDSTNLYALGALENLKGEIQILDGQVFNTIVQGDSLQIDTTFSKKAALLVYACVEEWTNIPIPASIQTYQELEDYIYQAAQEQNINPKEPFPFLLEGTFASFDWHVINWKEGDTEHSHEKHIQSGLYGTAQEQEAILLGFYSDSHHAIYTHHTTNMHIHVQTNNQSIAGHVDDLTLGQGIILKLPTVVQNQ